jgi:hypothetical protein
MRNIITIGVAAAALVSGSAVQAQGLQISYSTDASMDCAAISAESARMDQLVADANARVGKADGSAQGAGLASTVAVEGMLRTGVLGRVPGAGMFANQAASLAKQRAAQVRAEAETAIQTATTRKAVMVGLYQGKACDAPQAAAPAAESAAAPTGA